MTQNPKMSLDVSAPSAVPAVLAFIADKYRLDVVELQSAHQDKHAGREWIYIAKKLEKIEQDIRSYLASEGYTEFI